MRVYVRRKIGDRGSRLRLVLHIKYKMIKKGRVAGGQKEITWDQHSQQLGRCDERPALWNMKSELVACSVLYE